MKKGDIVFATRFSNGDPAYGWAIGFYDGMLEGRPDRPDRHMVVDGNGNQFRGTGYARAEVVPEAIARALVEAARRHSVDWPVPGSVNLWDIVEGLKQELATIQELYDN
jgi:hypothetical protein